MKGFSGFEPFRLSHGIGVEIYDLPPIVSDPWMVAGEMVMCIEPPYNELGHSNFLIEDEVHVTESGYEKLTDVDETLPIVGYRRKSWITERYDLSVDRSAVHVVNLDV